MQRNVIIAVIVLVVIIGAIALNRMNPAGMSGIKDTEVTSSPTTSAMAPMIYTGELPCADCEGIDVVLTMNPDTTYTMSNTYKGRDVAPFVEKGNWNTLRGDATNPDATVYELTSSEQTKTNYLVAGDQLKQLDADLKTIDAPFNTSLTKKAN